MSSYKTGEIELVFAREEDRSETAAQYTITEGLKKAGIEPVSDSYELLYKPDTAELRNCYELGREIALRVKTM